MVKIDYAYVCPHCKNIIYKKVNINCVKCTCGYNAIRFGRYSKQSFDGLALEELEDLKNNFLYPKLPCEEMIVVTDDYVVNSIPFFDNRKFQKKKMKDYSYWSYMLFQIPVIIFGIIFGAAGGAVLFSIITGGFLIILILSKNVESSNLEMEKDRRYMNKTLVEKIKKDFYIMRIWDLFEEDIEIQPIEKKYLQIKYWRGSIAFDYKHKEKQDIYLKILQAVMTQAKGNVNNIKDQYENGEFEKTFYDDLISHIQFKVKYAFDNKYAAEEIYNYIMTHDTLYYFDIDKEE